MPNSYEHSYQHNLDDVIDASDAVLAIGTEKVDTTTLKDRALSNDATIHGAMPSNGYFDGGRIFDGDDDYLNSPNTSIFNESTPYSLCILTSPHSIETNYSRFVNKGNTHVYQASTNGKIDVIYYNGSVNKLTSTDSAVLINNVLSCIIVTYQSNTVSIYHNGVLAGAVVHDSPPSNSVSGVYIGAHSGVANFYNGDTKYVLIFNYKLSLANTQDFFNTIARLPLYSHNFERYPNSDTSLISVFPYTSGIITSGSFNKTDGLKCTSAGQIIFSNSFEFDGNEYITLIIDGVEYSGTTTVTQGTITATIAQGSNDITIDMGTGDVLPHIRVQFRKEV